LFLMHYWQYSGDFEAVILALGDTNEDTVSPRAHHLIV